MPRTPSNPMRVSWTQLGLELVVVVTGILLALAIDSWWSDRQERGLEAALLTQLSADLVRAEGQLQGELNETRVTAGAASKLVGVAWGELEAPWDSVSAWLRRVTIYSDPIPTVATAQAIATAGDLHIVRSDPLRAAIVAHVDEIRQLDVRVVPYERELNELVRGLTELIHPRFWSGPPVVGLLDGEVEGFVASGLGLQAPPDGGAILRTEEFTLLAYEIFWVHEDLRWLQAEMLRATASLRAQLQSDI